ncbi:MAG TPA: hypothetical protein VMI34_16810 [Candidatus Bathyarchaeia archaeon]|nr:hypothetical protein [Candidatus Bathyarchaeia archaeon]
MVRLGGKTLRMIALGSVAVSALAGGCISYTKETSEKTEKTVPVPVAAAAPAPADRVITYPEGRYQLYGDGTRIPYYWVWIPSGSNPAPAPPAPPPVPAR